MDLIGRKGANVVNVLPCVSTWLLLTFARKDQVLLLYFARFLGGISAGENGLILIKKNYCKLSKNYAD